MSDAPFIPPSSYRQEDVQHILQIAIARQIETGEVSRQHLLEIAQELEISPKDLEWAERDWLGRQDIDQKRLEFQIFRQEKFKNKVVKYLIINGFVISLNVLSAGTISWAIYLLILLGLPLALDAWKTFQSEGPAYEQAFERWQIQNEVKESFGNLWSKIKRVWQI
jgi:hypothetical protein